MVMTGRERAPTHSPTLHALAPAAVLSHVEPAPRGRRRTLLAFAAAAVALVVGPLVAARLISQPAGERHVFEIPAGTADRLAAGDEVEVLPADLQLSLNDRLVVINRDHRAHRVGPFTIAPGQRLDRRFADGLSFSGFCSVHPSGSIDIEVRPRG